jgi:SAM-dependent methyltransferase
MNAPWYETAFGSHYADIYGHRDRRDAQRAVAFLERSVLGLLSPQAMVLDLCCGEGRHSIELLHGGSEDGSGPALRPVGMDLSMDLLRNAAGNAARENVRFPLVRGDMRALPFRDGSFSLVLNLFTSFGYFEDDAANETALRDAARVLARPGGLLVLDHINPPHLRANLKPETERVTARGTRVRETRCLDAAGRRVEKRIEFRANGREHSLHESVRLYESEEILTIGQRVGLSLIAAYGDFDGSALDDGSPRAIHVFRAWG